MRAGFLSVPIVAVFGLQPFSLSLYQSRLPLGQPGKLGSSCSPAVRRGMEAALPVQPLACFCSLFAASPPNPSALWAQPRAKGLRSCLVPCCISPSGCRCCGWCSTSRGRLLKDEVGEMLKKPSRRGNQCPRELPAEEERQWLPRGCLAPGSN